MADKCYTCDGLGIDGVSAPPTVTMECVDCGGSGWADPAERIKELEAALPKAAMAGIKAGAVMSIMRVLTVDETNLVVAAVVQEALGTEYAVQKLLTQLDPGAMAKMFDRAGDILTADEA